MNYNVRQTSPFLQNVNQASYEQNRPRIENYPQRENDLLGILIGLFQGFSILDFIILIGIGIMFAFLFFDKPIRQILIKNGYMSKLEADKSWEEWWYNTKIPSESDELKERKEDYRPGMSYFAQLFQNGTVVSNSTDRRYTSIFCDVFGINCPNESKYSNNDRISGEYISYIKSVFTFGKDVITYQKKENSTRTFSTNLDNAWNRSNQCYDLDKNVALKYICERRLYTIDEFLKYVAPYGELNNDFCHAEIENPSSCYYWRQCIRNIMSQHFFTDLTELEKSNFLINTFDWWLNYTYIGKDKQGNSRYITKNSYMDKILASCSSLIKI